MTEHDTQSAIIDLIRLRGGVATRINSGSMIAKSGDRAYRVNLAEKGTSDIIALYKGVYMAIEVKHGKNTATAEQLLFLDSVARAGGVGLLAYDTEFVESILNELDKEYDPTCGFEWLYGQLEKDFYSRLFVESK